MPQKVVASVGLSSGKFGLQPRGHADARAFSVGYRVHYFAAAIGTVAAGEELGVRGLAGGPVNHDPSALQLKLGCSAGQCSKQAVLRPLPNGQYDQIHSQAEL